MKIEIEMEEKSEEAECDMKTLIEAEKIKKDKKRLEAALSVGKEKITSIEQLKEVAKKKYG